jgi:hypothetical protein
VRWPRLPRRWRVRLATAVTILCLAGGFGAVIYFVADLVSGDPAAPPDSDMTEQLRDAARFALARQGVQGYAGRRLQQETPTRWQVSLVSYLPDGTPRCWKVAVAFEAFVAAPVGQPALVGCWPLPNVLDAPAGGEEPDDVADAAARGFLNALLTGADWRRWAAPFVIFPQPAPLAAGDFALLDSHQDGATVSVNGWVDEGGDRVDVTWRVRLVRTQTGLAAVDLDGGPPPPSNEQAPRPTAAPTTSTTNATTTTRRQGE